jgi:hypothetical protein
MELEETGWSLHYQTTEAEYVNTSLVFILLRYTECIKKKIVFISIYQNTSNSNRCNTRNIWW